MSDLLLTIHILAVTIWFGGSIMVGYLNTNVMKLGRPEASAGLARVETKLGLQVFMPMSVLTLLSGIGLLLLEESAFEFSDPFVSLGFLTIIIAAILGPVKFMPLGEQLADALEAGDQGTAEAVSKQLITWSLVSDGLLLITIIAMVFKPGT